MRRVGQYWVDSRGNKWDAEKYTREQALDAKLINCTDCINCFRCINCHRCTQCSKCNNLQKCNRCYHCVNSDRINDCHNCDTCTMCNNCNDCKRCKRCTYCLFCEDSTHLSDCEHCLASYNCCECKYVEYCNFCLECERVTNCNNTVKAFEFANQPQQYSTLPIGSRQKVLYMHWNEEKATITFGNFRGDLTAFERHTDNNPDKPEYIEEIKKQIAIIKNILAYSFRY